MMGAVIVATEDEAGANTANVAGGCVTNDNDQFLASRDSVDFVSRLATVDELSSSAHMLVQLAWRAEKKERKMSVQQVPKKSIGESGFKARVKVDFW